MTGLGGRTWPEVAEVGAATLLLPVGSTEQHGPHLPLDTDTRIAVAVAARVAESRTDVMVAPPLAYGASGEHAGFPGTLSAGTEATTGFVVELVRSAIPPFAEVIMVNGHGGNAEALTAAERRCRAESRPCRLWSPHLPGADAHAGVTETSLMLAIAPEFVRLERIAPGLLTPIEDLWPLLRRDGLAAHSPTGVLGDPTGTSAEAGDELLKTLVRQLDDLLSST